MNLLDRLASRRSDADRPATPKAADESVFPTKALQKFLGSLTSRETPVLLDLGPVIGSNVTFFGEQLGCKILVYDLFTDWDRHIKEGKTDAFPEFLKKRFDQDGESVDGVLCWDILDYLDRPSTETLTNQLARVLRPGGALLGLYANTKPADPQYTKYMIVDETTLKYRPYPAARGRQPSLPNRDIQRLFSTLRITESFLLKNNLREILFRKPTAAS